MSPAEIARRLREVAEEMTEIGTAMDYYGGFDGLMAQHGREMVGAALLAREWADEIAIAAAMPANAKSKGRPLCVAEVRAVVGVPLTDQLGRWWQKRACA